MDEMDFKHLGWDTAFFGFKTGRLDLQVCSKELLQDNLETLSSQGYRLVYGFVAPNDTVSNTSAVENRGMLVDEKVIYYQEIKGQRKRQDDNIRPYEGKDPVPRLYNLAFASGVFSRFKCDSKLPAGSFEKMYSQWIEKSVSGELADFVLVYAIGDELAGFVTLKIKGSIGVIGLIAVDEAYRGRSVGSSLMNACMDIGLLHKLEVIEVATQKANNAACRFYEKNNFEIKTVENIYHFWL